MSGKTSGAFHILRSRSGQGILEYILVLIVIVITVLGLVYRFNTAFAEFARSYIGDYVNCLLETGELPALGGSGGVAGLCNESYKPFTITDGRPLVNDKSGDGGDGTGGSGGGGSGSGGGGSDSNEGPGYSGGSGTTESSDSSGADSGRATYAGSAGRGGRGAFRNNRMRAGSDNGDGEGSGQGEERKKLYTGSTDGSIPGSALSGSDGSPKRFKVKTLQRNFGLSDFKEEQEAARTKVSIKKDSSDGLGNKERLPFKRMVASEKEVEEDEEFSFGEMLRFLIIAAIIIAIVFFLGSQIFQISKSME